MVEEKKNIGQFTAFDSYSNYPCLTKVQTVSYPDITLRTCPTSAPFANSISKPTTSAPLELTSFLGGLYSKPTWLGSLVDEFGSRGFGNVVLGF